MTGREKKIEKPLSITRTKPRHAMPLYVCIREHIRVEFSSTKIINFLLHNISYVRNHGYTYTHVRYICIRLKLNLRKYVFAFRCY